MNFNKKTAFTLSEVLLTITLIGFLATMTLSTVGSSVQQRSRLSQFRTAYSKMDAALRSLSVDEGKTYSCFEAPSAAEIDNYGLKIVPGTSAKSSECTLLMNAFVRAMGATRFCDNKDGRGGPIEEGCLPENNYPAGHSGCFTDLSAGNAYVLDNSMIIFTDGNKSMRNFAVDINGRKGPNKWGQDIFPFSVKATDSAKIGGGGTISVKAVGIFPPSGDDTNCKYINPNFRDTPAKRKIYRTTTEMLIQSVTNRRDN